MQCPVMIAELTFWYKTITISSPPGTEVSCLALYNVSNHNLRLCNFKGLVDFSSYGTFTLASKTLSHFTPENSYEFSTLCADDLKNPINQLIEIKYQTLTGNK